MLATLAIEEASPKEWFNLGNAVKGCIGLKLVNVVEWEESPSMPSSQQ
jgi:hypothetical protein